MVENAPPSVDIQEFQYKLHSKLKIFENTDDSKFKNACSLVAAASRYGLVFVGTPNGTVEVIKLESIEQSSLTKHESSNFSRRSIALTALPSHLAVNCDQTLLAVTCYKNDCATAIIYNVASFFMQNIAVVREIRLSATPGVLVLEAGWNPSVPGCFTACKADGSLGVYNITENSVECNELPVAAAARCFCWSPKGKQLVVGSTNGSLTQYKPDLKAVKVIAAPVLGGTGPYCVLSVFWISNYQFIVVFKDNGGGEARPVIVVVNAPKTGPTTYINYDDVCYSYGTLRAHQYYILHQPIWGVTLFASANSSELVTLGLSTPNDPAQWVQWTQLDASRAELPLSANHIETYPIGVAFDTGVQLQLPWGENQLLPPMPFVYLLSHHGVLCAFSVINLRDGVKGICQKPERIEAAPGVFQEVVEKKISAAEVKPQPSTPAFGASSTQFGSVAQKPQLPAFGAPASVVTTLAAPGSLPGWSAGSTLFGSTSFASLAPATSSVPISAANLTTSSTGFNFKAAPTAAVSSPAATGNLFSGATVPASLPALSVSSNLFGNLGLGTNVSIAKPAAEKSISTSVPNTVTISTPTVLNKPHSATTAVTVPVATFLSSSNSATFPAISATTSSDSSVTITPITKPLLTTPKLTKPDLLPQKSSITPETTKKDESSINDQMLQNIIKEEVKTFQSELQELFNRCKSIKLDVGTEEEKTNLVLTTESLLEFYKELQDTTDSQVAEVHYLKQALMQTFAWYEDSKTRHRRYSDPNFAGLLQAQELDPVSEKQLADIKHLIYYIEAQLKQVDSFLDNQWADFQDSCKKQVKGRLQIPTLEPIYQSMVRQNAVIDKQKYVLKDIAARIKSRNKKAAAYPQVINLSNTKNIEIDEELKKLKIDHGDLFATRYDRIVAQEKKFTDVKQSKLCSFFTNRNVIHISPKKPKFVNSILNTPSKLNTYSTPTSAQRNLAQAFNKIDSSFNDSPVETNLSSSNLFSFSLLDGASSTKLPEKATPKATKIAANLFMPPTSSVFNFTAASATTTQSKPVMFGSGDMSMQFTFSGSAKTAPSKFSTQIPTPESKDVTLIKPSVQRSTAEPVSFSTTPEKSFNFVAPQAKPALVINNKTTNLVKDSKLPCDEATIKSSEANLTPRDSIGPNFNFGSIGLGQQSTPKPKTPQTVVSTTVKPVVSIAKPAATIAKPLASIVVPKPAFSVASVETKPEIVATTETIGTFFGSPQTTGSIFAKVTQPEKSTANIISNTTIVTPTVTTAATCTAGFSFTQAASKTAGNIFADTTGNLLPDSTSNKTTETVTETVTEKVSSAEEVKSSPSIFATTKPETFKPAPNIFGGGQFSSFPATSSTASFPITSSASYPVTSSTASSFFGGAAPNATITPTTGFSFLQQSKNTTIPVQKPTAIFPEKTTESTTTSITSTTQNTFGFGSLAVSTTSSTNPNNFSFGNLTVSALSPAATPTTTTISSSTGFSFTTATTTSGFSSFSSNLFGKPAEPTTTTAGTFLGQPICSPSSFPQSGTAFGQNTGNIFAQKSTSTGSIFGQTAGGGLFSQTPPVTSASTTSLFGQTQTNNPFGGSPATTQTSGGSIFGQTSAFGAPTTFGTFGAPATTSSTSFSFTQSATSGFGASGGSIFGAKPTFGSPPAFGQPATFGAPPAFGGSPTGGNIFGSPAASTAPGSFGSGFGSPSAFGQKPNFGSPAPSTFGQSAFGSPPAFGGSPSFGSPQRVFGSTATPAAGNFGPNVQENSTFANLANQSTIGFGNLVQNQPTQQQQPPPQFSGGAQFSSWR